MDGGLIDVFWTNLRRRNTEKGVYRRSAGRSIHLSFARHSTATDRPSLGTYSLKFIFKQGVGPIAAGTLEADVTTLRKLAFNPRTENPSVIAKAATADDAFLCIRPTAKNCW